MNVGKTAEELVHDDLRHDGRDDSHGLLHLAHVPADGRGHVLHDEAQVCLILLFSGPRGK